MPGEFTRELGGTNFNLYIHDNNLTIKGYYGKALKPSFFYRYKTKEELDLAITRHADRLNKIYESSVERKVKKKEANSAIKAADHFSIGEILVNTWGYEQTNIEFYQVTKISAKRITVAELKKTYTETGFMCGHAIPNKDSFVENGDTYNLTVKENGAQVRLSSPKSFYSFSKWDGRPEYESHYA
jgi:hypothetical protein